jgi:hypothetical protein
VFAVSYSAAISALTLNTRRDDYNPPADEPTAQADEKEKGNIGYPAHAQL